MRPISNQPGKIYATTKTHKFYSVENATVQNLKFRPTISQIGTYTYNAPKVLSDYLKQFCQNNTKSMTHRVFASQLKDQPPLDEDEEYISYDVDSLVTNIPMQETIDYIIHQIYTEKKLPQICSKTIFTILLLKVTTECLFQLKQKLYKQTQGCSIGGPLSVTLTDFHMIRTENDVVKSLKPLFYKRYIDDIYTRRKRNCTDQLYHELNNHHPNINLTTEVNPKNFLDTQVITKKGKNRNCCL